MGFAESLDFEAGHDLAEDLYLLGGGGGVEPVAGEVPVGGEGCLGRCGKRPYRGSQKHKAGLLRARPNPHKSMPAAGLFALERHGVITR